MGKEIIGRDYSFARSLDKACNACRQGEGNEGQLDNLRGRAGAHPNEGKAIGRMTQACNNCENEEFGATIRDRFSCAWRVGIEGKE